MSLKRLIKGTTILSTAFLSLNLLAELNRPVTTIKPINHLTLKKLCVKCTTSFNVNGKQRYTDLKKNKNISLFLHKSYIDKKYPNYGFQNSSTGNNCGPVAVKNLLQWYGISVNEDVLANEMKTNSWSPTIIQHFGIKLPGTNTENIKRVISEYIPNKLSVVHKHNVNDINQILAPLKRGYPVLVNYRSAPDNSHWAVVLGVEYKDNGTDPVLVFANARKMSWNEFRKRWEKRWKIGQIDSNPIFSAVKEYPYTMIYIKDKSRVFGWDKKKLTSITHKKRTKTYPARPLGLFNPILPSETPIWKIKLRVEVADVKKAGTDDPVYVKFKGNRKFYLDSGWNDFDSDDSVKDTTYDIAPAVFKAYQLKDIDHFILSKEGTDGLCIRAITIKINDDTKPIFYKYYGNSKSTCKWIDGNDGHDRRLYFSKSQLKSNTSWYLKDHIKAILPPSIISGYDLRHSIETNLGDQLKSNPELSKEKITWDRHGDKAVEFDGKSTRKKVRIDIDLKKKGKAKGIKYTAELNVDFDLVLKCEDNTVYLATENSDVSVDELDVPWYIDLVDIVGDILTFGVLEIFDISIDDLILGEANSIANKHEDGLLKGVNINTPYCPTVYFDKNKNLIIKYGQEIENLLRYLK